MEDTNQLDETVIALIPFEGYTITVINPDFDGNEVPVINEVFKGKVKLNPEFATLKHNLQSQYNAYTAKHKDFLRAEVDKRVSQLDVVYLDTEST